MRVLAMLAIAPVMVLVRGQRIDSWRTCDWSSVNCDWTSSWACPGSPAGAAGHANADDSTGFRCCCQVNDGYVRIRADVSDPANLQALDMVLVFKTDAPDGTAALWSQLATSSRIVHRQRQLPVLRELLRGAQAEAR